jgi:hypothetical protein
VVQPPEWLQDLRLRQVHLILRLPLVRLQIDNRVRVAMPASVRMGLLQYRDVRNGGFLYEVQG